MTKNTTSFSFEQLRDEIAQHETNAVLLAQGYLPLFSVSPTAKVVIIGQAPGIKAQISNKPWDDASGERLIRWLGIPEKIFRDPALVAHMPMDFYYPGKGKSGDLPPRREFAPLWHGRLLQLMPQVEMTILVGRYAQQYYLDTPKSDSLTVTVRNYRQYLPTYFPLVHPSPLNFRWLRQNQWFEEEVVPDLQARIQNILRPS